MIADNGGRAQPVDMLLDRLDGLRQVGHGRWVAECPVHRGRRPALAITEKSDSVILLHCFAGCAVADIVAALGLQLHDLFPPRLPGIHRMKPAKQRFSAAQVLPALSVELLEVALVVGAILQRGSVTPTEHQRLLHSISRVMVAEGACHE
ncbi:hypothetical protein R69619_03736 [Paraburkholderia nemoris]|uniref:hypothetical protein n=1 Tax=Paraburkholderia nemoris TaxID=2793076 RepID=UPI00190DCD6C|nr:hypothetical protein [Paraburkholderia nemoris]MBK3743149.1 DNA primase [Paraburkholderia aspalathi]CAE6768621.1 hypothetical protein R69619_03736 [Paraburkholderia nemoris]